MGSIDASGYAKGAAAMARGVQQLGAGIHSLGSSMQAVDEKNSAYEVAKFNAQWNNDKINTAAGLTGGGGGAGTGTGVTSAGGATDADPYYPAAAVEDAPSVPVPAGGAPAAAVGSPAQVNPSGPYDTAPVGGDTGPMAGQSAQPQQSALPEQQPVPQASGIPVLDDQVNQAIARRDAYLATITDPRKQELARLQTDDDISKLRIRARNVAQAQDRDANLSYLRDNGGAVISKAIVTDDPSERARLIDGQMKLIDAAAGKGYMTQQQATAWKSKWRNEYAKGFALSAENRGPDAVNNTISELENARFNAANAPLRAPPQLDRRSSASSPMQVAKSFLGAEEHKDNQVLASFIEKSAGKKVDPAQTAWCAAFVNAVMGASGVQGTGSLMARSFLNFGSKTDKPSEGDVVVLSRGNPNGPYGHVGLFAGYDENGNVKVLAGNQGNRVSVASYPAVQVLGFRKPPTPGDASSMQARAADSMDGLTGTNAQSALRGIGAPITGNEQAESKTPEQLQQDIQKLQYGGAGQPYKVAVAGPQIPSITAPDGSVLPESPPPDQTVAQAERRPTIYDAMDPVQREETLKQLYGVRERMKLDEERAINLQNKKAQQASDVREQEYLKDIYGDDPKLTAKDVVNDPLLTREAKERIPGIMNRADKPDPLSKISQQTAMGLLDRIRLPDGDPNKITTLDPIYDAYLSERLTKADLGFLRKEFADIRTPEGESLSARKSLFLDSVKATIDKSNPLMGTIDASGKQQLYQFNIDLDRKMQQYRAEGKNPYDLLDPSKPDFMGKPDALAPYQKTLQQSIQDQVQSLTGRPGAGSKVQTAPSVQQRLPGESPADYLKRTQGK